MVPTKCKKSNKILKGMVQEGEFIATLSSQGAQWISFHNTNINNILEYVGCAECVRALHSGERFPRASTHSDLEISSMGII